MLRKARFVDALRLALAATRAAAAWLGLAVIVSSLDAEMILALLAAGLLVAGGVTWTRERDSDVGVPVRFLVSLVIVAIARWAGGPAAAALAAVLLALGAWLRIRPAEAMTGLAVFGAAVAVLGRGDARLIVGFWLFGLVLALLGPIARRTWRRIHGRGSLRIEKPEPPVSALRSDCTPPRPETNDLPGSLRGWPLADLRNRRFP